MCRYDLPGVAPKGHSRRGEGHYMLGQKSLAMATGERCHRASITVDHRRRNVTAAPSRSVQGYTSWTRLLPVMLGCQGVPRIATGIGQQARSTRRARGWGGDVAQ